MKKPPFKLFLMIGVLIIMLALTACSSTADYKAKAENLLRDKYAEDFQAIKLYGRPLIADSYTVSVCPVADPSLVFEATIGIQDDSLSDEYISRCISAKIEKIMAKNLVGLEGDYFVKAGAAFKTTDSDDAGMSIEQYLEKQPGQMYALRLVYVPGATGAEEIYATLTHTLDGLEKLEGTLYIYLTDDAALQGVQELFTRTANVNGSFEDLVADSTCIKATFAAGKLNLDKEDFVSKAGEYL